MSESKPYVEVVIRFYPEAPIKQHTIDYIRGRAHDYAGSMLFAAYRNPRVVSVKRRTPMADPLALNPEERALASPSQRASAWTTRRRLTSRRSRSTAFERVRCSRMPRSASTISGPSLGSGEHDISMNVL
jgi:hypothetical protein